uniref:Uncharacterized protein n=1 Tax=Anguilla anguilla TaxID=7936 RepID=A0A0E9X457_ANGAN
MGILIRFEHRATPQHFVFTAKVSRIQTTFYKTSGLMTITMENHAKRFSL